MERSLQVDLLRRILRVRAEGGRSPSAPEPQRHPVSDYTSEEQLGLERERLFRAGPLCVGLGADVPDPGSYLALDVAGVPLLLVRDREGRLRAFRNACRHRGAPVACGRGRAGAHLVCPYHGWSYQLDGRLAARSESWAFEGVDPTGPGLVEVPVAEELGTLWVRATPGEPLEPARLLAGLARELAGFELAAYRRFESVELEQRMNWKLVVDTFMEQYHLPVLHRESLAPMFLGTLALHDAFGDHGRLVAVRRSILELEDKPESDWCLLPHTTLLYFLFPNVVLIYQQDHVQCWQVFPAGSVDAARMVLTLYVPPGSDSPGARAHFRRHLDLLVEVTTGEDFAFGERIQRGHLAGSQPAVLFGRNEAALIHYHRAIRRRLDLPVER